MKDLKYTDILKTNKALGEAMPKSPSYEVKVLSNIITSQFNEIFEFFLRSEQINAKVTSGDYDNILQDSKKYTSSDTIIIFWELSNLVDGLQYKADTMGSEEVDRLIEKTKSEIDFVFQQLSHAPNVIFNKFSSLVFSYSHLKENTFERIGNLLNDYVCKNIPANFTIVDIDKVFARLSIEKCVDLRYYYSAKSLYSIEFYKEYAKFVLPIVFSLLGKAKKALIFDCDNTLWNGVVGEDGVDGIGISAKDKNGGVFEEIHHLALALSKQGVILGLCSKNNPEDVAEVFLKRDDLALKSKDILIKKINWNDKVTNLREIATELNIGLDSLVFIDDSSFEVNYLKQNLSDVTTLQVPEKQYAYPALVRDNFALFYRKNLTKEDGDRANLYRIEESRKNERERFASLDQYLASLQLSMNVFINDESHIERAAQLTQKTNQFNLSTRRNTESEIRQFIASGKYKMYVFSVSDKFGEYGITGMALVEIDNLKATIDTFLMSCRVIGRNIETAFLNFIIKDMQSQGVETILAQYVRTMKNKQVESFYDHFGFSLISGNDDAKMYSLVIREHQYQDIDYITLKANK
jgi:FkbH-like protein